MGKLKKLIALLAMLSMLAPMAMPAFAEEDLSNLTLCNDVNGTSVFKNQSGDAVIAHAVRSDGMAGKEVGDKYSYFENVTAEQIYTQIQIPEWTDRMKRQYFTTSAEFYVQQGVNEVHLVYGRGQAFAVSLAGTSYKENAWNKIKFIYDAGSTTGTFGYVTVYINDIFIKSFSDRNNELSATSTNTGDNNYRYQGYFRLRFKGSNMTFAVDNINCVATDYATIISENFDEKSTTSKDKAAALTAVGNSDVSYESGVEGKDADDVSMLLTQKSETSVFPEFDVPVTAKYVRVKFNVKTDDKVTNEYLGTFQSQKSSNSWKVHHHQNEWTSVELIIQNNDYASYGNANFGAAVTIYINGIYVEYNASDKLYKATNKKYFPMRLIASTNGNAKVYYDDLTVIAYNEYMPARPAAEAPASFTSSKVSISVPVAKGIPRGTASIRFKTATFADLVPTGKSVKVFTSNALTERIANNAALSEGNVIMAVGNYGEIVYYDVVDDSISEEKVLLDINFDNQTLTGSTGSLTPNKPDVNNADYTGSFEKVAGKNDYSFGIANLSGVQDTFQTASATISTTNTEFFTVSFNFYSYSDNFDKFYLGTQSGQRIGGPFTRSDLPLGRWNKVVFIYHNENPGNVASNSNVQLVCNAYINGVQIATNKTVTAKTSTANTIPIRFGSDAMMIDNTYPSCKVYYDDIIIKTHVYEPTIEELTAVPEVSISDGNAKIDKDIIYINSAATVDSIVSDASNTVRIYTDDSFSSIVGSGKIYDNNIVVVENENKTLNYYKIKLAEFNLSKFELTCDNEPAGRDDVIIGTYKYKVTGMNPTSESLNVTPIIALYNKNGTLIKLGFAPNYSGVNVNANTWEFTAEATIDVTEVEDGMYIKTFVWDMRTLKPYDVPLKVLVIGNSYTYHNPNHSYGWIGSWGMAASAPENDYVHQLQAKILDVSKNLQMKRFNISTLEKYYLQNDVDLNVAKYYQEAVDFNADIIIASFGANIGDGTWEGDSEYESVNEPFTKNHYKYIIDKFNKGNDAVVIACNTLNESSELNTSKKQAIYDAASENGYIFVDISDIITNYPAKTEYNAQGGAEKYKNAFDTTVAANGTISEAVLRHPGDTGMKLIAERIFAEGITPALPHFGIR